MSRLQRVPEKTTEVHEELEDYSPQHPVLAYEPKMNLVRAPDHLQQYVEVNPFEHQFQSAEAKKILWKIKEKKKENPQYQKITLQIEKINGKDDVNLQIWLDKSKFPVVWTKTKTSMGKVLYKQNNEPKNKTLMIDFITLWIASQLTKNKPSWEKLSKYKLENWKETTGFEVKFLNITSMTFKVVLK